MRLREPRVRRAPRALEARQRLVAGHEAGAEVDDRLEHLRDPRGRVLEHVLDLGALLLGAGEPGHALGRLVHRGGALELLDQLGVGGRVELLGAALAVVLRRVHGEVGAAQQLVDGDGAGARHHQPDAHRHVHGLAVEAERAAHRVEHAARHALALRRVHHLLDQQRELVAAEPRGGVGRAQAAAQARGHRGEQSVAGRVAERVVHDLEVVEVHEQERDRAPLAGHRLLDAVEQQRAVRELGERVVERAGGGAAPRTPCWRRCRGS